MNYFDYLKKMFSELSEIADHADYKKFNENFDKYEFSFDNGDKFEFISSGRYITIRFTTFYNEDRSSCYTWSFIYRSINGDYGLFKTYVAERNFYRNYRHTQGYRPEYTLLEAHNIVSRYNSDLENDYPKYSWDEWQEVYKQKIDKCLTVATIFPNTPDAREIIMNHSF